MNVKKIASLRVLVVEDDGLMRDRVCRFLARCGYRVDGVGEAGRALRALRNEDFALVIADARLVRSYDIDLVQEIHRMEGFRPWVVYTGVPDPSPVNRTEQRGVFCILVKGSPTRELLWSAEEACRNAARDLEARCA